MLQAILLGIVAFIAQSEYALGTSLLSRPIVTGLFTGIVLGDVSTGIIKKPICMRQMVTTKVWKECTYWQVLAYH